jgi:mRNA-degrading endonuclease RelE of RelBE toxin-antitoxin system
LSSPGHSRRAWTFQKSLKKLDRADARHVLQKLSILEEGSVDALQKMKHAPRELQGLSKIRVGEWRVLLWLDEKSKTITLL